MTGKNSLTHNHVFLSGKGDMRKLIREKDWSATALGNPEKWPQSLRTMVSVVLANPFGMYIAWGNEYIQIYNDSFSKILGSSKHPNALGISSKETFSETWHIIGPMLEEAVNGIPVASQDFMLPMERQGSLENCYFDFTYTPILKEDGEVGGVLMTVIETTDKKKAIDDLKEREDQLQFALEAAELASFDYDPSTNKFSANNRLKEWFGLPSLELIDLKEAISLVQAGDRKMLSQAISESLNYSSGGILDLEYSVINRNTNKKTIVHAKGKTWFNEDRTPNRASGILEDVTDKTFSQRKIAQSEQRLRSLVESAPFPIAVYSGKEMEVVVANQSIMDAWGKGNNVVGKKYQEILPELEHQEIFHQVQNVFNTGVAFHAKNQRIELESGGILKPYYFNYSFTPLYDDDGLIYGVMNTAADVTELNEANQHVEKALADIKLFKFMADNAGDPFILMREDGSFAYLNNIAFKKWGYSSEEINQIKVPDIDPAFNSEKFSSIFELAKKGPVPTFETTHRSKNGNTYPVEVSLGGVHLDGINFAFAIARDITQRKKVEQELLKAFQKIEESEKRFRNSVDQAPMGIATFTGKNFISELANDSYLAIVEKNANDFITRPLFEVFPELKETVLPLFNNVVETGQPFYASEFAVDLRRNGKIEKAYFNFVYNPIKNENGDISGIMVVATEVTNMVNAKVALQKSEKHFRDMVMRSPIPMAILKGDKYIINSANQVMFNNVWRKSPEDILGKSLLEVFPELTTQKYPELLHGVFITAKTYSEKEAVAYIEGDDGMKKFYFDFEYAPLFQEDDKVWGIMITVNDVTDMVEARKKVEEAEQRLRLATEFTGVSTWDLDLRTGHIIHSPQLAVLFGHSATKTISHAALREQVHPDDISSIVEKAFEKALEVGMYEYEARIILPDKPLRWIRTQGRVFYDERMQPIQILGTTRDITTERSYQQELLESESRFRLLADSLPQQIWTADTRGRIFYFNQTVYDFSGLTREQMDQKGWIQMVHPDDQQENSKVWAESISSGKDFLFEHRFRRYDGEYRWQLSRAIPQRDKEGNIQMWVGSSTDIQEIKEQEQQKDYFISMASHELKTPLTSIKGYVQLLQTLHDKGDDSFLKNSLKIIDRQIVMLTKLISELLDVSKIKSDGLDFKKEHFEISELIEEVVTEIKLINPQYEILIEAIYKIDVYADRNRIGQVLINFLNNAVKYAPQSKTVNVKCVLQNEKAVVSVQDFGIGINKQDQEKIFERFYRVEGRNEKTYPGFGIGLFIVSEIIKRHDGVIRVESEPGRGSVFTFAIPANLKTKKDA